MLKKHLRFAREHDWGRGARLVDGRIVLVTGEVFSTFDDLLQWAGY